jgi:hypothetical protein
LLAARILADGQSGPVQYAAHGAVAVSGRMRDGQLAVNVAIRPGWHINAHEPLSDKLIPTVLEAGELNTAGDISEVSYPPPVLKTLGFQSEKLALYEGGFNLKALVSPPNSSPSDKQLQLTLRLQACDEKVCLPPEKLRLQVPVP